AALAADGDDERLPGWRHGGRLAGGVRQPRLRFTPSWIVSVPLRDGSKVAMINTSQTTSSSGNTLQLVFATGASAICFAGFGFVPAMMPILKKNLGLDPVQVSVALAVPVLLGSLGRIPLGMLTDRYGGRSIFSIVMACSIAPTIMMGFVTIYWQLTLC